MKIWFFLALLMMSSSVVTPQSTPRINLELGNTTISEDGANVIEVGGKINCGAGQVLTFHLPQKGWFVASVEPFPGYDFKKIGKLHGNKITFKIHNRRYEITSDHSISSTVEKLDLWVVQISPPADKAEAQKKSIGCATDFQYWLKAALFRDVKN